MRSAWLILTLAVAAQPVLAQNARSLRAAAERALNKERWCDAAFLYAKLDVQEPGGDALALAGEAAERANDRARAVAFYKSFIAAAPRHPRVRSVERSITALEKLIGSTGNGQACGAAPPPECGNGLVEGAEACDDGNTADGDKCSRTCGGGGYTAAPTPLPVVTPVPVAVPLPAPPPPPPVPVVAAPPAPVPPPKPAPLPTPAPAPAPTPVPADGELCTLIKPVKVFQKGEWKTLDFGSTVTIKAKGPEFTKVESSAGEAKIASSSLEGACAKEGGATKAEPTPEPRGSPEAGEPPASGPAPLAFEDPEGGSASEPGETPAPDAAAPDPELKAEREREEKRIEPLADERKPAAEVPEVEEEGGGGIGGWITAGIGGAILAGGATAGVFGALPYFNHRGLCGASPVSASGCPALDNLGEDFTRADDDEGRADAAVEAERLKTRIDNAAQQWDAQGRWLALGGAIGAGVGALVTITGAIIAIASGGGEEEAE